MARLKGKLIDDTDFVTEVATADGIATSLSLSNTPIGAGPLHAFANGLALTLTSDFTVSGSNVNFTFTPAVATELVIKYIKR